MSDEPEIHEFEYPFVWEKDEIHPSVAHHVSPDDPGGRWKPGHLVEGGYHDGETTFYCNGMGRCRVTVIDRYKPKGCREHTFFRRQWIDPQGNIAPKDPKLIMLASYAFKKLITGYRFPIEEVCPEGTPLEEKVAA